MQKDKNKKTLAGKISDNFVEGLIIVIPLAITAFAVMALLSFTEETIGSHLPIHFPGVGLVTIIISIWLVGLLSGHKASKKCLELGDRFLDKIPVVKFIYSSVKKFSAAIFESDSMFKKVVLVPHGGVMSLGFLMNGVPKAVEEKFGDDYVCVFIPWSLNMTSGINFFVKKSEVIPLDMEPEDALQFILTAGTTSAVSHEKLPGDKERIEFDLPGNSGK